MYILCTVIIIISIINIIIILEPALGTVNVLERMSLLDPHQHFLLTQSSTSQNLPFRTSQEWL